MLFLPPSTKLWQGNVFTPVCHCVHKQLQQCIIQATSFVLNIRLVVMKQTQIYVCTLEEFISGRMYSHCCTSMKWFDMEITLVSIKTSVWTEYNMRWQENYSRMSSINCYHLQSSCSKVMFSQAFVILFTKGVYPNMHWHRHPVARHLPWADITQVDTPRQTPPGRHPPGRHPLSNGSCSRWYASYWNAFLFIWIYCCDMEFHQ